VDSIRILVPEENKFLVTEKCVHPILGRKKGEGEKPLMIFPCWKLLFMMGLTLFGGIIFKKISE